MMNIEGPVHTCLAALTIDNCSGDGSRVIRFSTSYSYGFRTKIDITIAGAGIGAHSQDHLVAIGGGIYGGLDGGIIAGATGIDMDCVGCSSRCRKGV